MRTNRFARTRADHSRETAEDYVELVHTLISEQGEARITEIAARMGVSKVTVTKTIQRLIKEGLVTSEPYRSVFLTDAGKKLAIQAKERHELVLSFLLALGISEPIAESDAEGIEHHVSEETLNAMKEFVKKANS